MAHEFGGMIGDFTVCRISDGLFQMTGSGALRGLHSRWFKQHLPSSGVLAIDRNNETGGFTQAGPLARELLGHLVDEDLSTSAFPFRASRRMAVSGIDARVFRVSITGDLGYEIHVAIADQGRLYDAIWRAGEGPGPLQLAWNHCLIQVGSAYGYECQCHILTLTVFKIRMKPDRHLNGCQGHVAEYQVRCFFSHHQRRRV
jgi:glycine cleavage system aminomethyltransferase T